MSNKTGVPCLILGMRALWALGYLEEIPLDVVIVDDARDRDDRVMTTRRLGVALGHQSRLGGQCPEGNDRCMVPDRRER